MCSIPKKDGKKVIDDIWLYTILAMIGENFDAGHELCGAVIRCADSLSCRFDCLDVSPFSPAPRFVKHRRSALFADTPCFAGYTSLRKAGDRVAVWTRNSNNEKACLEIGNQFKSAISECLQSQGLAPEVPKDSLEYLVHDEALEASKNKNDKSGTKSAKYKL